MPELAEVEYYRKQWEAGLNACILAVRLHETKRIFRGANPSEIRRRLKSSRLLRSTARGKQMLFVFSGGNWLGLHLGMSGTMRLEPPKFRPAKHDHLVLAQAKQTLVFRDPRQFGRVRFHHGKREPDWWTSAPPDISSAEFSTGFVKEFLLRHGRAPIKGVLLMQAGFAGIGNWMADEILWRAKIVPAQKAGTLDAKQRAALRRATRFVSREALRIIGHDNSDLPKTWLIHQRWKAKGVCPKHKMPLKRATIGGRTTAWCARCQPSSG
jgi:formamidopyrimidine-DNA glycosylase